MHNSTRDENPQSFDNKKKNSKKIPFFPDFFHRIRIPVSCPYRKFTIIRKKSVTTRSLWVLVSVALGWFCNYLNATELLISPGLIKELKRHFEEHDRRIKTQTRPNRLIYVQNRNNWCWQKLFRMMDCMDPMATEKLASSIRSFIADIIKMEKIFEKKMGR